MGRRSTVRRAVEGDIEDKIVDKWKFEKVLDVYDEDIDKHGLTYLVK